MLFTLGISIGRFWTVYNFISWLICGWVFCSLVMTYLVIKAPIREDYDESI